MVKMGVYQFDHVEGVVQKIDKNAKQLKEAIESVTGIIITTLQKFPVIYQEVNAGKNVLQLLLMKHILPRQVMPLKS